MLYGVCTGSVRETPNVPAIFYIEQQAEFRNGEKMSINQRDLWWARQGLNLRPHPCEGCALPLSYAPAL